MTNTTLRYYIKDYIKSADKFLLIFLLAVTFDSVVIKVLAIALALAAALMARKITLKNIFQAPLFYIMIPALELLKFFLLNHDFSYGHTVSFITGLCFWLMNLFAFVIVKKRLDNNGSQEVDRALNIFFVINVLVSLGDLIAVMYHAHSINPYNLDSEIYGNSTGDFIHGVMRAPCFLNMCVNAFFAIYFLYRKKYIFSFIAVVIAVMTSSNFANFIFFPVLILLFFVLKEKKARYTILLQFMAFAVFYLLVSKGNRDYVLTTFFHKTSISQNIASKVINELPINNKATVSNISTANDVNNDSSNIAATKVLLSKYGDTSKDDDVIPFDYVYGKKVAFQETFTYLMSGPMHFLFGAGMGNFSSQLASRTADLPIKKSRLFQKLPIYIAPDFYDNHYRILYQLYRLPPGYHSIKHTPNSFWNQIFGEYGMVGFAMFLLFYAWYFLKKWRYLSYSWGMMMMIAGFLTFDYLFEYLSVTILFELFFLLDISRPAINKIVDEG